LAFPWVADLFLYWYEDSYFSGGVDSDNPLIHSLQYASRYIDDLNVPNIDDAACDTICKDIYPDELDIIPTNDLSTNTTFLDLDISIDI
jgi:hypothetical protein